MKLDHLALFLLSLVTLVLGWLNFTAPERRTSATTAAHPPLQPPTSPPTNPAPSIAAVVRPVRVDDLSELLREITARREQREATRPAIQRESDVLALQMDVVSAPLFRRLKADEKLAAALRALLRERFEIELDIQTIAAERDLGQSTVSQLQAAALEENNRAAQAKLSSEQYRVLAEYAPIARELGFVAEKIAERMHHADQPLTDAQCDALAKLLHAHRDQRGNGRNGMMSREGVAAAETVLSPAQLELLKSIQEEEEAALWIRAVSMHP